MKKFMMCVLSIIVVVSSVLPTCAQPQPSAKIIEWKVLSAWAQGYVHRENYAVPFINLVNERAKGELVLRITGGPESWPMNDQVAAVRDNVFQAGGSVGAYTTNYVVEGQALQFISAPMDKVRDSGLWDLAQKAFAKQNIRLIGAILPGTPFLTFTKKPVRKLTDFRGLIMREPSGFFSAFGASCVNTAVPEIYTALQQGVIDGLSFPVDAFVQMKWYEQTKYIIFPGFGDLFLILIANLDAWNVLPNHLKELVSNAALEIEKRQTSYFRSTYEKAVQDVANAGLEKIYLSETEGKKFQDAFLSASFDMVLKKSPDLGPRMLKLGQELRK